MTARRWGTGAEIAGTPVVTHLRVTRRDARQDTEPARR